MDVLPGSKKKTSGSTYLLLLLLLHSLSDRLMCVEGAQVEASLAEASLRSTARIAGIGVLNQGEAIGR